MICFRPGLVILFFSAFLLGACEQEHWNAADAQVKHCTYAVSWYGRATGKVTIVDTREFVRREERIVTVTYDVKTKRNSPYGGASLRLFFRCGYPATGDRKTMSKAVFLESSGKMLSKPVVDAMNVRIGLLGGNLDQK